MGQASCTVIVPEHLSPNEVQRWLSMEKRFTRYWQHVAITAWDWIIVSMYLPQRILKQPDELDYLRARMQ